jgi:hypothetical protein
MISVVSKKSTITSVKSNIIVYPTVLLPPTFLSVGQITDNTIDISFTPPSSGDVDKYTVVATYGASGRVVQDISKNQNSYTITGIQSNILYTISVFATNLKSNSAPSNSVTARTFLSPPGLQYTGRTSSIITLLVSGGSGTTGLTYFIEANDTNGVITSTNSSETTITLRNLTSDMLYSITVYSLNTYGPSSKSVPILVYTLLSPPTDLRHVSRTTNSITVSFTPPYTGNVVDYVITATPSTGVMVTQYPTVTTYEITNLQSGMAYTIRVFARNANGTSDASVHLHDYTIFSPPTALIPVGNTDSTITFSFTAPNGSVTGYDVIARYSGGQIGPLSTTQTSYTLTNLQSDTSYNISVIAKNADVSSDESSFLQYYTLLSPPRNLFITNPTDTSLFASFSPPSSGNIVEYIITTFPQTSQQIFSGTTHTITGLEPNTAYTIYVYARNSRGTSAALISANSYKTLLSPPTNMSAIGKTDTSINISYSAPSGSGGLPYKYDIYISYPQRIDISQNVSDTSYNITGLQPNTEYTLNVVARSADGNTSPPLTAVIKTLLSPPTNMSTLGKTDTSINISYTAPSGSGGSPYTYTITTSPAPSITISANITDTSYNITGLNSNTEYTINVVARSADGNTSPPLTAAIKTLLSPLSNLKGESSTDTSILISYSSPLVGSPYTYTITSSPAPSITIPANIYETSYNITGLTPNTEYTFTVVATSANNNNTSQPSSTTKRTLMSAPSALAATARTSSSITISFTSPSVDVIDYIVTAAASSGTIVSSSIPIATFPSYQITGLLSDNSYNISVVARNAYVFSMPSAILPYYTLLLPPTQIVVDINTITDSVIPILFSAPSRGTVGNYELTTTPTSGNPRTFTNTSYTITDLQRNTSYIINIVARNNNTNESSIALVSSSYKTRLIPPTNLVVDPNTITDTSMNISFSAPSDTSLSYTYEVTASVGNVSVGPQSFSGTSYTITGLTRDTPYNISVIAKIADGNTSTALVSGVSYLTLLPPPQNLQATGSTNTSITISFTLPTNTIPYSYNITLDPVVSSGFTVDKISDTYTINGLNSGIEYTISVTTRNSAGNTSLPRTTTSVTKLLPPTDFRATGNTENSITLSFTPSVGAVDKYIIYAQPSSGTTVTKEFRHVDSSYVIDGLEPGMTYDLWVVALNAKTTSLESTHVPYNTILPPPTLLNATASTSSSITISFTAPSSGTITNYSAYVTYSGGSVGPFTFSGTNYAILGLTSDTLYTIKVVASTNYVTSADSNNINKYTLLLPPTSLGISNVTDTFMNITFNAPSIGNVAEYQVSLSPSPGGSYPQTFTGTTYTLTGLTSDTSYNINVVARNDNGDSIPLIGTQRTLLIPPSQLISTLGNTSINISYSAPPGVSGYTYDISTNPAPSVPIIQGILSTNYNITGLQADTSYTLFVVSRNAIGNRSLPLIDTVRTLLVPPANFSATPSDTTMYVSYTRPSGGTSYIFDISINPPSSVPIIQGLADTSYNISGLLADTSYTLFVFSRNVTNTNTSLPLTGTKRTLLAPPTNLNATITNTSITISFTASTTASATNYEISASSIYGNIGPITTLITNLPYVLTGLQNDTSYNINIVAKNATNTNTSLPLTGTKRTLLVPPANFSATSTDTTMYVSYTRPSGGSSYIFDISINPASSVPIIQGIADTSYNISGLQADTSYTLFVVSRNATNTNTSLALTGTKRTLLAPPTNFSATSTDTSMNVTFTASTTASVTNYEISATSIKGNIAATSITTSPYVLTGLQNDTYYNINIVAKNTNNNNTSLALTGTQRTLLPPPTNLNVTTSDTSMNIAYTASTGSSVTNYVITITSTQGTIGPISNNTATSYVRTGLTKNIVYTISVVAKNAINNTSLPLIGTSQTKLPPPTDLQTTGRTSTSISFSFNTPSNANAYTYDISYTPVSVGSTATVTSTNINVTFPAYTTPVTGLDFSYYASGIQIVANGTRIVYTDSYTTSLLFYTFNGTNWSNRQLVNLSINIYPVYLSLTSDGTRGVCTSTSGYCYYFTWNELTQTYSGLTQTLDTTSRNRCAGVDMTPDGNTIVITYDINGELTNIFFAKWNNTNYSAFTPTLDIARRYSGVGISADGSKIAYGRYDTGSVYVAYWDNNNSNYGVGTEISMSSIPSLNIRFSPDGNIIYVTSIYDPNQRVLYSVWNGTQYSSFQYIPTISMPANINTTGFFVQRDGSINIGFINTIYSCAVSSIQTQTYNINGLQYGTSYTISVNSKNDENNVSLPVTTTYNTLLLPPENVKGVSRTENSITISFTEPAGPINYYIVYATYDGIPIAPQTFSAPRTTCEITGLQNGRLYTISVVSQNAVTTSANSTSIDYYTVLSAPTLSATSSTSNSITISYTPPSPSVTSYTLQAIPSNGSTVTQILSAPTYTPYAVSYTISGLDSNMYYTITMSATNANETSVTSTTTYYTAILPPTGLVATSRTINSIDISFNVPSGLPANFYTIKGVYSGGSITDISFVQGVASVYKTYIITGLLSNTQYSINVVATNANSTSSASNQLIYSTLIPPPTSLIKTAITETTMDISFNKPTGTLTNTSYTVNATYSGGSITPQTFPNSGVSSVYQTYQITGLYSNTSYTVNVFAINTTISTYSLPSTSITHSTLVAAPSNLIPLSSNPSTTTIDISFNKSYGTITNYSVNATYSGGSITPQTITPSVDANAYQTYKITGLRDGTKYTITLTASNSSATSSPSTSILYATNPYPPSSLSVTARTTTSLTIAVTLPTVYDAISYFAVEINDTNNPIRNINPPFTAPITTFVIGGLTGNTQYSISVKSYITVPSIPTTIPATNVLISSVATSTIVDRTLLPSPTNLRGTVRTGTSITIAFDPPTDGISYLYDVSYTPISAGSSVSEIIGGITNVSFSNYTTPIYVTPDTFSGLSSIQLVANGTRLVCSARNYGYLFFYSYNGTTWNRTNVSQNDVGGIFSLSVTPDGSRVVLHGFYGLCYYFTWNASTQIYSGFTQTRETISRTEGCGFDMTPDGNTIILTHTNDLKPRYMYFAKWENGNYNAFTPTLDVSRNYYGAGISADGSKIAYALQDIGTVYVAYWNGTNYGVGTAISTTSTFSRHVRFSPDGKIIYNAPAFNASRSVEYSIYNGSTYPAFTSLPTASMPANIDTGGFFVQTDGSICMGISNYIYRCAVTTITSKAYTINGLQVATSYTISVNTKNADNNISSPITTTYSTILPEPTYLIATGRTTNSIDISFNKLAGTIDRYTVNATYSGGSISPQTITPSIDLNAYQTYSITGLLYATQYTIYVTATKGGYTSSASNSITYSTLLSPPTNLMKTAINETTMDISFNKPTGTITTYTVNATYSGGTLTPAPSIANGGPSTVFQTYQITGLLPGTTYTVNVVANNTITNSLASNSITETTPIVYNLNTWTEKDISRNWTSVAMSQTGQYRLACVSGGQIYLSTDYGNTWTAKDSNRSWKSVCTSSTGQYSFASVNNGNIYVSSDYGNTWTAKAISAPWNAVSISSTGQYGVAANGNGNIYVSSDYGNTWTAKQSQRQYYGASISSTGQYGLACAYGGQVYTSNDYGNTWTGYSLSGPYWYSVSISSTGQYGLAGTQGGQIYISSNYGITWTAKDSNRNWLSTSISSTGQYGLAGVYGGQIYISKDYGNTWTAKDSNRNWLSTSISSTGQYGLAGVQNGKLYLSTG